MRELDRDRDGSIAQAELIAGVAAWFVSRDADRTGRLPGSRIAARIERDLAFDRGGPPGARGPQEGDARP